MSFRALSLVALTPMFVACGGDSGGSSSPAINVTISEDLKGRASEPDLITTPVENLQAVALNTLLTSYVVEDSWIDVYYTAAITGDVAVVLSSAAENLDLLVSDFTGLNTLASSKGDTSDERLVFTATSGFTYRVRVKSEGGSDNFQVRFAAANRETLGLTENEYFVKFTTSNDTDCVGLGYTLKSTESLVINWKNGYIINENERMNFSSVSGTTFIIEENSNDTILGLNTVNNYKLELTLDAETGLISGSEFSEKAYAYAGDSLECRLSIDMTGLIVL